MKLILGFLSLVCVLSAGIASEAATLTESDLIDGVMASNFVSREQAQKVVQALAAANNNMLPEVGGMMFIRGLELTVFVHMGTWQVRQMSVFDAEAKKWIEISSPYLYEIYYQNGGIALSLSYKFLWLFFSMPPSIDALDGAIYGGPVFGGGLGINGNLSLGLDAQVMGGINRPGTLFVVGPSLGLGGGLRFPNIKFEKKQVVPGPR